MEILLLGNGFDIHHKLPTTYFCFLKVTNYLCTIKMLNPSITIGKIFNEASKDYTYLKTCYDEYKSVYDSTNINFDIITDIMRKCQDNVWWKYFNSLKNEELGWIDFEKEISNVINVFHSVFEKNEKRNHLSYNTKEERAIISKFEFIFESYPEGAIKNKYLINNSYDRTEYIIDFKTIINDLFCYLNDFAEILKLYFIDFVDKPLKKMKEQGLIQKNMIKELNWQHVISFNYTGTYEELYSPANVHHIHGVLDKNIILGVNSDERDTAGSDNPFISFKKYYQRVVQKTDVSYHQLIREIGMMKTNRPQINLKVIGHSLDSTDKDIITEIFSECDQITICYHNQNALGNYLTNLINIYGKTDFDKLRVEKNITFFKLDS